MSTWREISEEEAAELDNDPDVVTAEYDDQPNDVADRFVAFLEEHGFRVEGMVNDDIPTIYYRITPPKGADQ